MHLPGGMSGYYHNAAPMHFLAVANSGNQGDGTPGSYPTVQYLDNRTSNSEQIVYTNGQGNM